MRLSTRGRYAVRAMVDIALHAHEGPISRGAIAHRQGISSDYIAQLFRRLERAGLVEGVKGPAGGYRLRRPPSEITVGEIIRAVEGPIALVHCVAPGSEKQCRRANGCVTRSLWQQVSETLTALLDRVTLQDLCNQARERETIPGGSILSQKTR
ncbi:MAG: Rrf2 family transcriptional regulator [Anaerolineae bacterium]|nr:Rrf2 family transcriptional regulator [Anaerolineae bacterium]MDW8069645.1 Rrf2 family transcriptional regulator [Anaerolineae bacterium]